MQGGIESPGSGTLGVRRQADSLPPRVRPAAEFRPAGAVPAAPDDYAIRRCQQFLGAIRSVYLGTSCLTSEGAAYMGIPFRFPTMAEAAASEPPADVRPLRGKALQEAAGHLRQIRKKRSH